MLGKIEDRRMKGPTEGIWLDSISDSMDMSMSKLWEMVKDRGAWWAKVLGVTKSQTIEKAEHQQISNCGAGEVS